MDKPRFLRAKSNVEIRKQRQPSIDTAVRHAAAAVVAAPSAADEPSNFRMRHGWEAQLQSDEQANLLSQV